MNIIIISVQHKRYVSNLIITFAYLTKFVGYLEYLILDLPRPLCYCKFLNVDLTVIYIITLQIIKLNIGYQYQCLLA